MATNRLSGFQGAGAGDDKPRPTPPQMHVLHTPFGVFKVAVTASLPGGKDPLQLALGLFRQSVENGSGNPIADTLLQLKSMAETGAVQPLQAGLSLIKQMTEAGALPPLEVVLQGSGVLAADIARLVREDRRGSLWEKIEWESPN